MRQASPFTCRHFPGEMIRCAVRCYVRMALSNRYQEQLTRARRVPIDHATFLPRVQRYAQEPDTRCRRYGRATKDAF